LGDSLSRASAVPHGEGAAKVAAENVDAVQEAQGLGDDETSEQSWHIEDYEDPNDMLETRTSSRSGSNASDPLACLSLRGKNAATAGRHAARTDAGALRDAIGTADLKRLLLEQRPGGTRSSDAGPHRGDTEPRLTAAFRALFGMKERGADSPTEEYYTRRINREEGVDIGELRRELRGARSHEEAGKGRLKMAFF
jgi:hypothetical protein